METLKNIGGAIAKGIARLFNSLPKPLRIGLMIMIAAIFAGWTKLLIGDIQGLENVNKYLQVIADAFIPVLTIAYNLLLEFTRERGTELLAAEKDPKTIDQLETKVEDTKALIQQ